MELQKANGLQSDQSQSFALNTLSQRECRFAWLSLGHYEEQRRAACIQAVSEDVLDRSGYIGPSRVLLDHTAGILRQNRVAIHPDRLAAGRPMVDTPFGAPA